MTLKLFLFLIKEKKLNELTSCSIASRDKQQGILSYQVSIYWICNLKMILEMAFKDISKSAKTVGSLNNKVFMGNQMLGFHILLHL